MKRLSAFARQRLLNDSTAIALGLISLLVSTSAQAESITFHFEGIVNEVAPQLAATFAIGQPATGSFTFESIQADTDPVSNVGAYVHDSFEFTVGPYSATTSGPNTGIEITDGSPTAVVDFDIYKVQNDVNEGPLVGSPLGTLNPWQATFQLTDATATAIDNTDLILVPPNLSDWPTLRRFTLTFQDAQFNNYDVRAIVTSITAVAVPSLGPFGIAILCGLVGLSGSRRLR